MSQNLQAIRGMHDILPAEAEQWEVFEDLVRSWLHAYGYKPIRMPIVEPTPLFSRAIGEVTDIVEKEMYSFVDSLNGEALTLRPEGTASCVRAVLQHNLLHQGPQRLYYGGPMFRHERPAKGRYRQFHQFGVESFGFEGPDMDAEQIIMIARLWADLGIEQDVRLEINTLGSHDERASYRRELVAYLEAHTAQLDEDSRRRLVTNPLRVLDSKNPAMQALIEAAPRLESHLGDASKAHFERLQALLRNAAIPFRINHRLVRGLDYYNLTVFEWVTDKLGAQGTICAGGRYDGLVSQLGGKATPACGFALGVERVLALWQESGCLPETEATNVYLIHAGAAAQEAAFRTAESLRDVGLTAVTHCGGGSFKSQMRKADASGASIAVILGEDELAQQAVTLKVLRGGSGQIRVPIDDVTEAVADLLYKWEEDNGSV